MSTTSTIMWRRRLSTGVGSSRLLVAAAADPSPQHPSQPRVDGSQGGSSWRSGWGALVLASVSRALLVMAASLWLWSVAPAAIGWHSTVVMSDSMAPRLMVGDVVGSRPISSQQLRVGQVLLVDDPDHAGRLRLHRLVDTRADGQLTLRGDANPGADSSPVARDAVHGVGSLRVPAVGAPVYWAATGQWGRLLLTGTGLAVVLAAAFAFRPEEVDADDRADSDTPHHGGQGEHHGHTPATGATHHPWRRLCRMMTVAVATVGLVAAGATGRADAAVGFAQASSNSGNTWAADTVPPTVLACGTYGLLTALTVKWTKIDGVTGYTVHYGTGGATTRSVSASTVSFAIDSGSGTVWVTADRDYGATTWASVESNHRTYRNGFLYTTCN